MKKKKLLSRIKRLENQLQEDRDRTRRLLLSVLELQSDTISHSEQIAALKRAGVFKESMVDDVFFDAFRGVIPVPDFSLLERKKETPY